MLTPQDLGGVMGMMPAFATADSGDIQATSTIDVGNLKAGVERAIADGMDVISTTGSFGEFHTLLDEEFQTLMRVSIDAVAGRVPLFVGCTSLNSREAVRKMRLARDAGAQGVLVGVPFYFPSTVDNAINFYCEISELFPSLAIMIYHNPALHHVTLPVDAVSRICEAKNVVAMKDSHRDTPTFMRLAEATHDRLSVFVNQGQYHPYAQLGAAGCWSIEAWMGPWPLLRLRDAVRQGDRELATQITLELTAGLGDGQPDLQWRETASKIAIAQAGYVQPGPLRPPFNIVPDAVMQRIGRRVESWQAMCEKYRPRVKASVAA